MVKEESTKSTLSLHSNNRMAIIDSITTSTIVKSFVAGSFSGTCSTILFQPFDLVKTRIQTAIHIGSSPNQSGMFAVFGNVVKNEQIFGLWRGMTPSIVRCVPGVGLYYSSLHWLRTTNFCKNSTGPVQDFAIGAFARTFTGVTMIPITVIKTRYESGVYSYRGIGDAIRLIYAGEGVKGFACGLLPTLLRDAPFSGLYLMFYTQSKKNIPKDILDGSFSPVMHFGCGVMAGVLASGITQPFDVLKTKMQLYPNKFDNIFHAAIYVKNKYGMEGYFKGIVPRMVRRTLMVAMAWTVYEQVTKSLA